MPLNLNANDITFANNYNGGGMRKYGQPNGPAMNSLQGKNQLMQLNLGPGGGNATLPNNFMLQNGNMKGTLKQNYGSLDRSQ